MAPKKDPEDELREEAARGNISRPQRTYCEACSTDCGTPLALRQHIKREHPA